MAVKGKGKQVAGKAPAFSPSSSGKRKSTRSDGESSGAPPKKKPSGVFQFFDDAAADADYEEEEEDDDLEWEVDEDFDFELPDIGAKEVKNVTKGPGKSSPTPFFIKEEEMDDDELEEAIKERYRSSGFVSFDEDVKECDKSLLVAHATKDLSVWRVKCMMGRERQAAFCLMQKFVDLLKIGKKLQIFSVFALDHVKGFFYVEADKACNVFEACNGLCILYSSRIELVPRNEAPNLLSIQKKACGISKGMWVRMKNGKYKGDLAEVLFVNDAKKRVTIKLVPRIDLQAIAKKFGGGTSLKAAAIPAPRLISSHELEDFRPHIEVRRDRETGEIFEVLDGLMLKDGYLYKKVSMCSLIHWGVQPSSDELMKFEDLGKDEAKDISWLSSIYKARMKKKFPETSHQKNEEISNQKGGTKSNQKGGEKSNREDGDKQRNGYDIDDLVLFGKKGCGIIIDKENDTFKVLKGDVNGSEVVSINVRVIKKNCVDKVFTATDRCMKTISIDDVVKVSEGSLEGREGIVRHMYKGVLFIYDECQSENNGFFCAKSEICDLVKKSRDFGGGKLSSNVGQSFAQSPIRSSEQDDNSQSLSRNRQSNSRGTFSVGQTLRICKGPLKGYLCRVIRIYRADITVKLDSLGKLLTVDEKLLSFSNPKRDDATTMQCDMFGSQEEQSTGGLGMDNFEFNAGMSSVGRDSWNTPSCSSFPFPSKNDSKDQNQEADPWESKLSSWNGDQQQGAANSWGKAPSSSTEQSSWNKMESGEKGADADCKNNADAWNKASTKEGTSTGSWQIDTTVQKTDQILSTKGSNSSWNSAVHSAVEDTSDAGGWNKAKLSTPDQEQGAANSWGKAPNSSADAWNKASSKGGTSTGGWKNDTPVQKTDESWNTKGASSGWDSSVPAAVEGASDAGGWNKPKLSAVDSGNGQTLDQEQEAANSWGKAPSSSADAWNKASTKGGTSTGGWKNDTPVQKTDQAWSTKGASSGWDSSVPAAVECASDAGGWNKAKLSAVDSGEVQTLDQQRGAADSWSKAPSSIAGPSSWNKMESGEKTADANPKNDTDAWNKASAKGETSTGGWRNDAPPVQKTGPTWSTKGEDCWNRAASRPDTEGNDGTGGWEQTKGATVGWNKETGGKDRTDGFRRQSGNWTSSQSGGGCGGGGDNLDAWGIKGKGLIVNSDDSWGNSAASQEIKPVDNNPWQNSFDGSVQSKAWKTPSTDENQAAEDGSQTNSWSKVRSPPSSGAWEKSKAAVSEPVEHESQPSSWDKAITRPSSSGWQITKQADSTANEGWKKDGFSGEGRMDGWNKEKSSGGDQAASGWNKPSNVESRKDVSTGSWDEAKSSEGRGFGQESRGQWKAADNWRNDSDSGQGSGWSQGNSSKSWGRGGGWNQQSDFDGGRGSSRGRGRGRYGGRGGRNEDSFEKPGDSDGGWRFGRGGGRGRNGAGGYNRDNSDAREFGRGRGRGRGRGQDHGQFQSSDWRNERERFDGGFSNKPSSGWGSTTQHSAGVMEKVGWNGGNSINVGSKPDWGTDPQNSGASKDDVKEMDNWSKETRNNDNWNTPKTVENKLSGWNQTSNDAAEGTNSSQSWKKNEIKSTNAPNLPEASFADWGEKTAPPTKENEAQGGWSGKKVDAQSGNNWGKWKEPCSGSAAENPERSKGGWGNDNSANWDSRSSAWDSTKEPNSSGKQSSDWNNGGANGWSEQSGGRGRPESWNRRSDSDWGGGRGRDNSFSRGRGRGRSSGGRHSYSWNGSDDSGKEGNDGWKSFDSNREFKSGRSWNGGNADKGSWGNRESEQENQPVRRADPGSEAGGGKSGWESSKGIDRAGSWETKNAPSGDRNSKSWNEKAPGWSSESSKPQSGWNDSDWKGGDRSNSGNGGNSGW